VQSLAQWGGFRNEDFAPAHLVWALAAGVLPSRATRAQGTYPGSQTIKLIVGFLPADPRTTSAVFSQIGCRPIGALRCWSRTSLVPVAYRHGSGRKGRRGRWPNLDCTARSRHKSVSVRQTCFRPGDRFRTTGPRCYFSSLLCVRNSLPLSTVAELIAFAKTNPGKLNFASTVSARRCTLRAKCSNAWRESTSPPYTIAAVHQLSTICGWRRRRSYRQHHVDRSTGPAGALGLLVSPRLRAGRWHRILPRSPDCGAGVFRRSGGPRRSATASRRSRLQGPRVDRANDPTLGRGPCSGEGVR
jgi:Tripartite tricarboxylate transporter family receptor